MSQVKLLSNKICPFGQRAWLTLLQKQVQFIYQGVSLTNKEAFFTQTYLNAYAHDPKSNGKVPVLIHGDIILTQSDLISWYVAETFNTGTQLIPENTFQRVKMRRFIQQYAGKIIGAFYSTMGYKKKTEEQQNQVKQNIKNTFSLLEKEIVGPYVLGENFSLADILTYPWLERWCVNEHYHGIEIPKNFQKLHGFIKSMQGRDSVKATLSQVSNEFYIQGYRSYMQ